MLIALALSACAPRLYTDATRETGCLSWTAPENSWPAAEELPCSLGEAGFYTGEVPPELLGVDQFGATVSLWQFYGHVTVVDISTMWCAPCQDLARGVQETAEEFAAEGLVYLTILPENHVNEVPSVEDLAYWSEYFGIHSPILSDASGWYQAVVQQGVFPEVLVLDDQLRVCDADVDANDAAVRQAIQGCL